MLALIHHDNSNIIGTAYIVTPTNVPPMICNMWGIVHLLLENTTDALMTSLRIEDADDYIPEVVSLDNFSAMCSDPQLYVQLHIYPGTSIPTSINDIIKRLPFYGKVYITTSGVGTNCIQTIKYIDPDGIIIHDSNTYVISCIDNTISEEIVKEAVLAQIASSKNVCLLTNSSHCASIQFDNVPVVYKNVLIQCAYNSVN